MPETQVLDTDEATDVAAEPDQITTILPIAAVAGSGASVVAAALVAAAARAGKQAQLVDAAAPRQSTLRDLATSIGHSRQVATDVRLMGGHAADGSSTIFVDGASGDRWDRVDEWPLTPGTDVRVVDLGLSGEDLTTTPKHDALAWATLPDAAPPWVVLVLEPTQRCLRRAEAVLAQWPAALPIAQVLTNGPGDLSERVTATADGFVHQALTMSSPFPWAAPVYAHGPLSVAGQQPLVDAATQILTAAGALTAAETTSTAGGRSRFRRRSTR